jgi:pimeloyl-ACP methyl ester carboxylesterase
VWLSPEFRGWNIEEETRAIVAPLLLVQGREDEYGTLAQVDSIAKRVRGRVETRVLERCGHSPHRDRPDDTLAAITEFVASL